MKKIHTLGLMIVMILLASCGTVSEASVKNRMMRIQEGMTKEDVSKLMGTPDYRRFDNGIEEWEYKFDIFNLNRRAIETVKIMFEGGIVFGLDTFSSYPDIHPHPPVQLQVGTGVSINH